MAPGVDASRVGHKISWYLTRGTRSPQEDTMLLRTIPWSLLSFGLFVVLPLLVVPDRAPTPALLVFEVSRFEFFRASHRAPVGCGRFLEGFQETRPCGVRFYPAVDVL